MDPISRRVFVSQATAGIAAIGTFGETGRTPEAQLVWKSSQWKLKEFRQLVDDPARVKQVFDCTQISRGKFLNNIKNSLNGLHYGFDIPMKEIKISAALHGPANMLNYDDYVWTRYRIGEWLSVIDPATGRPAVSNIFYPAKHALDAASYARDTDDQESVYQDTSIQALTTRGVQFLSCHTATEEQARVLIEHFQLSKTPEDIVEDMLGHTVPGVLVVTSMVASVAILQSEGRFSYITV